TGRQTIDAVRTHHPDVLVLDIRMPDVSGFDVLRALPHRQRAILFTASLDDQEASEAMRLGVAGLVLKDMAPQLLIRSIRKVHAGAPWIERRSLVRVIPTILRREAAVG